MSLKNSLLSLAPAAFLVVSVVPAALGCASVAPPEAAQPIDINGTAATLHGERYLEYRVGRNIAAPPEKIWALLTDAQGYPAWNSTVTSLEGTIAKGETIELKSTLDEKRTFKLQVSTLEPNQRMVWEDGGKAFRGVRTYTLTAREDGTTDFTMAEVITGTMLKMIEPKLPDFAPSFEQFAADLDAAATAG